MDLGCYNSPLIKISSLRFARTCYSKRRRYISSSLLCVPMKPPRLCDSPKDLDHWNSLVAKYLLLLCQNGVWKLLVGFNNLVAVPHLACVKDWERSFVASKRERHVNPGQNRRQSNLISNPFQNVKGTDNLGLSFPFFPNLITSLV